MWLGKKITAGALQYVLIVSVLIALIIFTFISFLLLQQQLQAKNSFFKEAVQNVQYGFDYLGKKALQEQQEFTFSDNPNEKTTLNTQKWGLFTIANLTSSVKNERFQQIGLLGNHIHKRKALYLKENNKPLALVGDTKIIGNASLPKQGIKRGNISGTSYNRNQLLYGSSIFSSEKLPKISIPTEKHLSNTTFFELEEGFKKTNSFTNTTLKYQTNGVLNLRNITLQGNIVIQSSHTITIFPSANLQDIILIAPRIVITTGVRGNFQAFATKKITVNKKCKLSYPTTLVLTSKEEITYETKEKPQISIGENSKVKGSVIFTSTSDTVNFDPQIILAKNSIVTGEVYCNQNLELLGSVHGSVYTNHFITKQFGSVYVNHIYNGNINMNKLPKQFCGMAIQNGTKKVAKWLY